MDHVIWFAGSPAHSINHTDSIEKVTVLVVVKCVLALVKCYGLSGCFMNLHSCVCVHVCGLCFVCI